MKRPLACFGFSLFSVLLCLSFFESTAVSVSLFMLGAVAFTASLFIKRLRQTTSVPVILFGIMAGCLLFSAFQTEYNRVTSFVGDNLTVSGVVTERPEFSRENRRYYFVIKADNVDGNIVKSKMRISFSETYDGINPDNIKIGDKVKLKGTVYKAGSYSESLYNQYKSRGIYLGAYSVRDFEVEKPTRRSVGYYIDLLRYKISSNLLHDFDNENASLLVALLTGDKSFMSDELNDNFIEAGIVHIMAVSGLHLSVWVAFFALFMDFRGKKGKALAVIMILFTVFMMNFASFTGSAKRASAMTILYFIGKILGRKTDALNSLGFACVCGLALNPFGVSDISFLLSFLSTLGIILMGVPLSEKMIDKTKKIREDVRRVLKPLIATVSLSVSVTVFIFPVSVLLLGGVSFIAPVTNLLVFAAVSPLLLLTGFYSFLRFVPLFSPVTAVLMKYLSLYIIKVAEFSSDLPFSYVDTGFERLGIWFIASFMLFVCAMLFYNYSRVLMRMTAMISAGVFLLSFSSNFYTSLDKCKVALYGEGRGSCAVISYNGKGVLVGFDGDYYDEKEIAEYTERNRSDIVAVVFTEQFVSEDKKSLCELLGTDKILVYDGEGAVLFDKVKITKNGRNVTLDASEIKTEIFSKEYLQDEDKYGTIASVDGKYVFSFRENNPYTLTLITSGGEKNG